MPGGAAHARVLGPPLATAGRSFGAPLPASKLDCSRAWKGRGVKVAV